VAILLKTIAEQGYRGVIRLECPGNFELYLFRIKQSKMLLPKNVSGGVVTMAGQARNIVFGSLGVSALMGIAAILDIVLGMPFGGQMTWDIMLILAAALVIYMGIDCLKEIR
jgi:hypothetical protein